nr:MAG TPA: hypothetical protein [Bacteriophage sp.]
MAMYNYQNMPYNGLYGGLTNGQYNYTPNYQNALQGQIKSLTRVNGLEGAKAFQIMPRETVALFDGNDDIFYIKSADDGGFPTIKAYRFAEVDLTGAKPTNDYVTKSEFEELRNEVKKYAEQSISNSRDKSSNDSED